MNTAQSIEDRKRRLQGIIDLYTLTVQQNRLLAKRVNNNNIYVEMLLIKMNKLKTELLERKNIHAIESETLTMLGEPIDLANDTEIRLLQQQMNQKLKQIAKFDRKLNKNVTTVGDKSDHQIFSKKMIELIFTKHCSGLIVEANKQNQNQLKQSYYRNKNFELEEINLSATNEGQVNEYWNYVSKGSNYLNEWDALFFGKKPLQNDVN